MKSREYERPLLLYISEHFWYSQKIVLFGVKRPETGAVCARFMVVTI